MSDTVALANLLLEVHGGKRLLKNKNVRVTEPLGAPMTLEARVRQAQAAAPQTRRAQERALLRIVAAAPTEFARFVKQLERERKRDKDPRHVAKVAAAADARAAAQLKGISDALAIFVKANILPADVLTPQPTPAQTLKHVVAEMILAIREEKLPLDVLTVSQAMGDDAAHSLHELINRWPGVRAVRTKTGR